MANQIENLGWVSGIYRFETTDVIEGGPEGVDNLPLKQLASRTKYLYDLFNAVMAPIIGGKGWLLFNDIAANIPPGYAEVIEMQGRVPRGLSSSAPFNAVGNIGGANTASQTLNVPVFGYVKDGSPPDSGDNGKLIVGSGFNEEGEFLGSINAAGQGAPMTVTVSTLDPYRIVMYIKWVGL